MLRKLILLAIGAAIVARVLKSRSEEPVPAYTPATPPSEPAASRPPEPDTVESTAETVESEVVRPDTSADDPLVRQQENAAAADAAAIGGEADTATADADEAMRPVVEGSGDAEETFEQTEDQGR